MQNVAGIAESALLVFGGVVAEVNAFDVPSGSAPVACDCDFTVASVKTRDGLQNVYSYAGSFILRNAGLGQSVSNGPGETAWTTPDNIIHNSPGTYASVSLNLDPTFTSVIEITFDPAKWAAGTGAGTTYGKNGYNAGSIFLDKDGTTAWAFEQPASGVGTAAGFARFNLSDGSIVHQDAIFNQPGNSPFPFMGQQAVDTFGPLFWKQDNHGFYYTLINDNSIYKFHIAPGPANNLLNGYCIVDAIFSGTGADVQDMVVWDFSGTTYLGYISADGHGPLNVVNTSTMTLVGAYSLTQNNNGQAVCVDTSGSIWALFSIVGSLPGANTTYLVKWNPADGVTGPNLNATSHNLTDATLGFDGGAWFIVYVPGNDTFLIGGGDANTYSNGFVSISHSTFLATGSFPDDLKACYSFVFRYNWAAFDIGLQADGTIAMEGDILSGGVPSTTQAAGMLTIFDPVALTVSSETNIPTVINASAVATHIPLEDLSSAMPGRGSSSLPPLYMMAYSESTAHLITTVDSTFAASPFYGSPVYLLSSVKVVTTDISELLEASVYTFSIPSTAQVTGVQVIVSGKQTDTSATNILTIVPLNPVNPIAPRTFQLTTSDGSVTIGTITDTWNQFWTPAQVNTSTFGFAIQASAIGGPTVTFDISAVQVKVWYTPNVSQFDYIKSFEMTTGDTLTLALDNSGVFWQEDILTTPNLLTPFYTAIEPNTFARSVTQDDREFIALSDLTNGTDMPRQYNGQWVDRLSQVGPGAPPSVSSTSTTYNVVSITQPAAYSIDGVNGHGGVQWTSGVNSHTPGNVIIPYTDNSNFFGSAPNLVQVGSVVYLQLTGAGLSGGNGTYFVTSTGNALGMESGDGESFNYFTVTGPSTQQLNVHTDPVSPGTYQLTVATLTVSTPVPGLTVGSQITLAGVSPGTWNGTWTITNVVNGGSLEITSTQLTSDVAIYNFTVTSGSGPAVGSFVTITGCVNGPVVNGQSIFNQFQAQVASVGPGYFTISPVNAADVPLAAETSAVGLVLGTIFQFDPGVNDVGTANNPILGNAGATGSLVIAGGLGAGLRQAVVMFETRNGYITQPSPPVSFNLTANANQITVTNLPIGPPNVIRRIVAFTGANGGFFFYIPNPVTVISAAQTVTYTSTVINDNTSSQATFNFTDTILLSSISIDSQGNNLFAEEELGSSIGVISYAQRIFAWGEQSKITNLLNMTFDGGYLAQSQTTPLQPLGWTIDVTNGAGGSLTTSPLFGDAYLISNTSGSTKATYGMIEQSAYQDYNKVPIITVQTQYSVRVTASIPANITTGNLVIDLYSPGFMAQYGAFTLPFSSMSTTMQIFTGTLLTTAFQTSVPQDLLIRVYATGIANNASVLIDRIEPFDTSIPTLITQLRGSYIDNFEAFDLITGTLGVGSQNQQPVRNAFELFDTLYIVRSKSMASTMDSGVSEPSGWQVREVSNKVGTPSIYGVDVGEGWALIAGEPGLYLFSGGEPVKISPELDGNPGIWQSILWQYGQKIWLRNDTEKRKIYIGVPMPTPNQWCPHFPLNANPTQPNILLVCNYKELMTSSALMGEGPVRLTYTGELKSYALGRKWSMWSIPACYADFINRPNTALNETGPIFFCSDTVPEIFQLIPGFYSDQGAALHFDYYTYPFVKAQEAQALQMGLTEVEAKYMTVLSQGSGNLQMTIYPDSINSIDAEAIYPEVLNNPVAYDLEIPLNQLGNRFFMEFYLEMPFEWVEISRVVMAMAQSAWMPVRGRNQ